MKKVLIFLCLILVLFVGFKIWWSNGAKAVNPTNKTPVAFVIKPGEGVRNIAYSLKQAHLISDPIVFFLLVKSLGFDGKIEAGNFLLSQSMDASQVAQALTHGTADIWITIPEGKRGSEIAEILQANFVKYNPSWNAKLSLNEGYLFPDTYSLPKDADIDFIISKLAANFKLKFAALAPANLLQNSVQEKQIVTIASIIQREAAFNQDMPLVASVINNRLKMQMALQVDPSVEYALGYQAAEHSWWKKTLTFQDLQTDSPYNTYVHVGLPPTPICNPGSAALQAAMHPAVSNYLYYYSDKTGHLHFAQTLEEHNINIQKYQ